MLSMYFFVLTAERREHLVKELKFEAIERELCNMKKGCKDAAYIVSAYYWIN